MLYAHGAIMGVGRWLPAPVDLRSAGRMTTLTMNARNRPSPRLPDRAARGRRAARPGPGRRLGLALHTTEWGVRTSRRPGCGSAARDRPTERGGRAGPRRRRRPSRCSASWPARSPPGCRWPRRCCLPASRSASLVQPPPVVNGQVVERPRAPDAARARRRAARALARRVEHRPGAPGLRAHPRRARARRGADPAAAARGRPAADRRRAHRRPDRHGQQPPDRTRPEHDRRARRLSATSTRCRPTSTTCTGSA